MQRRKAARIQRAHQKFRDRVARMIVLQVLDATRPLRSASHLHSGRAKLSRFAAIRIPCRAAERLTICERVELIALLELGWR